MYVHRNYEFIHMYVCMSASVCVYESRKVKRFEVFFGDSYLPRIIKGLAKCSTNNPEAAGSNPVKSYRHLCLQAKLADLCSL